jgi:hypothetical protein
MKWLYGQDNKAKGSLDRKRQVWEKWAEITLTDGRGRVVIGSDEPPDEAPTLECFSALK